MSVIFDDIPDLVILDYDTDIWEPAEIFTTAGPTTPSPTTPSPTTLAPTTITTTTAPSTAVFTTPTPTTLFPTTVVTTTTPTTPSLTTLIPTTFVVTTFAPTTSAPIPIFICTKGINSSIIKELSLSSALINEALLPSPITKEFEIDGDLCW